MNENKFQSVILIGAARSGTKLVRDLIALHPSVDKVPYDINYIWRIGNETLPHDEISIDLLTEAVAGRIRRKFESFSSGSPYIIEKTVSNCLRVPFVLAVFPDAKFIHLVRDGWDVVESSYRQWIAPPDWSYIIRKAVQFPLFEAFGYAFDYTKSILRKLVMKDDGKYDSWGPRYAGIDGDMASKDILEVCAIQWARSIEKAYHSLSQLPEQQVLLVHYEDFVHDPIVQITKIAQFCGIDPSCYKGHLSSDLISTKNVGKGRRNLNEEQIKFIAPHIQRALELVNSNHVMNLNPEGRRMKEYTITL